MARPRYLGNPPKLRNNVPIRNPIPYQKPLRKSIWGEEAPYVKEFKTVVLMGSIPSLDAPAFFASRGRLV